MKQAFSFTRFFGKGFNREGFFGSRRFGHDSDLAGGFRRKYLAQIYQNKLYFTFRKYLLSINVKF